MNLPSANRTAPAIFDNKIVLPIYQLADIPRDPIGTLIYFYKEGRAVEQRCQYRRGFKRDVIPNHVDNIPTSDLVNK